MQQLIGQVIVLLQREKETYQDLYELSEKKKEAILASDVDELDRIVRAEQPFIARLNEAERQRKIAVESLARMTGKKKDEITIKDFVQMSDKRQGETLEGIHRELNALLEKQAQINEVNRQLIESRLEYFNFMIDTMTAQEGDSNTYGAATAAEDKKRKSNIVDWSV